MGSAAVRLESVDDVDSDGWACTLLVSAEGGVRWLVTGASPFDVETYADLTDGGDSGAGWLADIAWSEPLVLLVSAFLMRTGKWRDIEIHEVSLEAAELERRLARADPDIEAQAEVADQESGDGPRPDPTRSPP